MLVLIPIRLIRERCSCSAMEVHCSLWTIQKIVHLGLRTVAVDFSGSEDGSWDDGDELVFWGEGPDWIGWNSERLPSGNTSATRTRTTRGISWPSIKNLTKGVFPRPHCSFWNAGYGLHPLSERAIP